MPSALLTLLSRAARPLRPPPAAAGAAARALSTAPLAAPRAVASCLRDDGEFPSLLITRDGVSARGPFAAAQAQYLQPDPALVAEVRAARGVSGVGGGVARARVFA